MIAICTVPEQAAFSIGQAAKYLGKSKNTVRKYSDLGYLKTFRRCGCRYFTLEDLDKFSRSEFDYRSERPVNSWKGL